MKPLVLVSQSPRRADLLRQAGIPFELGQNLFDESQIPQGHPVRMVRQTAESKVRGYLAEHPEESRLVLGADTLIAYRGRALGKPQDRLQASEMLTILSGKTHRVLTALCLYDPSRGRFWTGLEATKVRFKALTTALRDWYLEQEEWRDAAGAYKIQAKGEVLVEWIKGSYSNVVGLPLSFLYGILERLKRG